MKNLTKKERFDRVLAELKVIEGLDIIASCLDAVARFGQAFRRFWVQLAKNPIATKEKT